MSLLPYELPLDIAAPLDIKAGLSEGILLPRDSRRLILTETYYFIMAAEP